jgi:hypothetical protein
MWLGIAYNMRQHNPRATIPAIADRIIEYMKEVDSEFDFNPHRSKKTICAYLRKKSENFKIHVPLTPFVGHRFFNLFLCSMKTEVQRHGATQETTTTTEP